MATITGYTKAGTDAKAAPLATTAPLAPGVATAGTSGSAARADHVHPRQVVPGFPIGAYASPLGIPQSWGATPDVKAPLTPYPVHTPHVLKEVIFWQHVSADAGSFRIAVFEPGAAGLPDKAPVWVSADQDATSGGTGARKTITVPNLPIDKSGVWWFAFLAFGHTTTRALPNSLAWPELAVAFCPQVPSSPHTVARVSASGFNEATGALTAPYGTAAPASTALWAYSVLTAHLA